MSFVLTCPNCGAREVTDFSFGGEVYPRPTAAPRGASSAPTTTSASNVAGVQREWWFHRSGCRAWFQAERDTRTNDVLLHGAAVSPRLVPPTSRRASGIDRGRERSAFTFDGKPVDGARGRHDRLRAVRRGPAHVLAQLQVPPPRAACCAAPGSARTASCRSTARPGVRACTEPVRAGMQVGHLNASPSLDFDVMRATDIVGGPFTPPGFYYKTFIRPRRLWPLYEKVLRNAAGLGRLRKRQARARVAHRVPPPARRRAGRRRRRGRPGGRDRAPPSSAPTSCSPTRASSRAGACWPRAGTSDARELAARARAAGVELLVRAPALGSFDGLVPVWQGDTLHQVRAQRLVVATGAIEQPLVFAGNDLPGVMLSGGARRLVALYAVAPGTRAVVATISDRGLEAALALRDAGVEVAAVADLRADAARAPPPRRSRADGVEVLRGRHRARGRAGARRSSGVVLGRSPARRRASATSSATCSSSPAAARPATSLLLQAGARTATTPTRPLRAGRRCPTACTPPARWRATGTLEAAELSGARRGRRGRARARPRRRGPRARARDRPRAARRAGPRGPPGRRAAARDGDADGQVLRLPDEDVTAKDIQRRRGGLRLDRALQALHDRDDGPVPGPHVPAPRRAR